jgi:pterin-4a-carbinolamine dehydratase
MVYSQKQITDALTDLPNRDFKNKCLFREVAFKSFTKTFAFMTLVAFEAECLKHHSNWTNVCNKVIIERSMHDKIRSTEKTLN